MPQPYDESLVLSQDSLCSISVCYLFSVTRTLLCLATDDREEWIGKSVEGTFPGLILEAIEVFASID